MDETGGFYRRRRRGSDSLYMAAHNEALLRYIPQARTQHRVWPSGANVIRKATEQQKAEAVARLTAPTFIFSVHGLTCHLSIHGQR